MSLLTRIRLMLEDREDVDLFETEENKVCGVQMKRVWQKRIINADGMMPVEREGWFYYAQGFMVMEMERHARGPKKGAVVEWQVKETTRFQSLAATVILARHIDDVIDSFGPIPNMEPYMARVEK